jgi:plasmid stabilization system protein ParE
MHFSICSPIFLASAHELGPSIRSTGLWPYVVLYHVGDGTLDILRVVHGRHDITAEILQ